MAAGPAVACRAGRPAGRARSGVTRSCSRPGRATSESANPRLSGSLPHLPLTMRMTKQEVAGKSPVAYVARGDPHMRKPLVAALFALVIAGAGAAPAVAAPAPGHGAAAVVKRRHVHDGGRRRHRADSRPSTSPAPSRSATVPARSSASRTPRTTTRRWCCPTATAWRPASRRPVEVIVDQASSRTFGLLNSAGTRVATLRASKIAYGDDDRHGRLDLPAHQHVRADPELVRHQRADAERHAPDRRYRHHGRLRVLEADLHLQRRRVRLPPQGGRLDLEGLGPLHLRLQAPSAAPRARPSSTTPPARSSPSTTPATRTARRCTVNNPCEVDESGNVTVRAGHQLRPGDLPDPGRASASTTSST